MKEKTPSWVGWTYVSYVGVTTSALVGIPAYAVFWLDHSPWYLLIGLLTSLSYSPWRWFAIWDGVERPFSLPKSDEKHDDTSL